MPRRLSPSILTTVLAAAIAWPVPAAARTIPAVHDAFAGTGPIALVRVEMEESASLLGLESDDAAAGAALTKALRKAAAKRGLGGGPEMSLVEMRLTMGCENNSEACLAEGGKAVEVRQLIYGDLRKASGGYKVQLFLLDVGTASIASNTTVPLSAADLSPDKIDATASKVIQSLLPKETDDEPLTPGTGEGTVTPEVEPDPQPDPDPTPRDKKYEWGLEKPSPKWKKIGLGVTAGVGGAALIAGIAMQVVLRTKLRDDLLEAVDASDDDANPDNDISRGEPDLCKAARESPMMDGNVTNASVTRVCNKADGVHTGSIAALVGGAVLGAAAIAFTVLLFVHKKKGSEGAAALLRRDFKLGAAPTIGGGMRAGVGFRF